MAEQQRRLFSNYATRYFPPAALSVFSRESSNFITIIIAQRNADSPISTSRLIGLSNTLPAFPPSKASCAAACLACLTHGKKILPASQQRFFFDSTSSFSPSVSLKNCAFHHLSRPPTSFYPTASSSFPGALRHFFHSRTRAQSTVLFCIQPVSRVSQQIRFSCKTSSKDFSSPENFFTDLLKFLTFCDQFAKNRFFSLIGWNLRVFVANSLKTCAYFH